MILILAETGDPLAERLTERLAQQGRPARRLSEAELMEETPLAVERDGPRFGGFLRLAGGDLPLSDLSGVFVRWRRRWWPGPAFDPADQMFVYHETTAAMFCLLAGVSCPVINRFELGWWLCDPAYPTLLCEELGERLGMRTAEPDAGDAPVSVYAVDGRLIPAGEGAAPFVSYLAARSGALADWQRSSGLRLCRLDLSCAADPCLQVLDPCPALSGEAAPVVDQVAAAALEALP